MKLKLLLLLIAYSSFAQVPAYYSNIDFTQSAESIKWQLSTLITATHITELTYTSGSSGLLDTWTVLKQSDLDTADPTKVAMIYGWNDASTTVSEHRTRDKEESCHTSSCKGKWVREHTFPKSIGHPIQEQTSQEHTHTTFEQQMPKETIPEAISYLEYPHRAQPPTPLMPIHGTPATNGSETQQEL